MNAIRRSRAASNALVWASRRWCGSLWSTRLWFVVFYLALFEILLSHIVMFLADLESGGWHAIWYQSSGGGPNLLQMVYALHLMVVVLLGVDLRRLLSSPTVPDRWCRVLAYVLAMVIVVGKTVSVTIASLA